MAIKKGYAETPGGQIHYRYVASQADAPGLPLVFLHRTPSSSVSFEGMMEGLAGSRPLYALDTPGFGNSFDPAGNPTVTDYSNWLAAALDDLGIDELHLYGHHTGTHFATEIAAAQPQRVRSLTVNGAAYLTADERARFRQMVGKAMMPDADGKYLAVTWQLIRGLFKTFDPDLVHREFCGALRAVHTRDKAFNAIWDQDYPAVLARVSCPILALSCEDDFFADYLQRIPDNHANATAMVQGPGTVAAPELDTQNSVRIVREFLGRVEGT